MLQDLRFGMRMLIKRPGFSLVVILVMGLSIGATTAIFSVVNAVLLRPLPFPEPDRLMMVFSASEREGRRELTGPVFGPDFLELRAQCRTCGQIAAYSGTWPTNLTGGAEPERIRVARVSEGWFETAGVSPLFGRTFLREDVGRPLFSSDTVTPANSAVILSHSLWQRRFGSDKSVIGRPVNVEGDICTIVGVMPDGFKFPDEAEAWLPVAISAKRDNAYLRVIARLKTGVTGAQAQSELSVIARSLESQFPLPGGHSGLGIHLVPLQEHLVGDVRRPLLIFLGAVGIVLLIACANVANLLLARSITRQKELALRAALGASRIRIVRQMMTESLLLALAGAGLGLWLAFGLLNTLVALAPQRIPRLNAIAIDPWVLGFTLLLAMLTGLTFGLAPALQRSQPDLIATLKEGGARTTGMTRFGLHGLLIVTEVALALILLIGAGLLLKSFTQLRATKLGFNPDHVLTATVTPPEASYRTATMVAAYYEKALERLAQRPEVQDAGIVSSLPLGTTGAGVRGDLTVEGETTARRGVSASKLAVSGDYFQAMGIPLLRGRSFYRSDTTGSPGVVIISQALATQLWPHQEPLGKRLNIGFRGESWREVVGVVSDIKQRELGAPPLPALYQSYQQVPDNRRWMLGEMSFVVRTTAPAAQFAPTLRSELQVVDRDLPVHTVAVMDHVIAQQVADPRFYTLLLGSFSTLALILASAGIYSLVAYSVTQRTHEIGVRVALGAQARDVLRMVIRQGMALVLVGLVIGLVGARLLTRLLSDFLYQVSATDTSTFATLAVLLTVIALLACYLPARRATTVDPLVALREE